MAEELASKTHRASMPMKPVKIIYDASGTPTNLPDVAPVLLYGMDCEEAAGPVLGQWDSTQGCRSDDKWDSIYWRPVLLHGHIANKSSDPGKET